MTVNPPTIVAGTVCGRCLGSPCCCLGAEDRSDGELAAAIIRWHAGALLIHPDILRAVGYELLFRHRVHPSGGNRQRGKGE